MKYATWVLDFSDPHYGTGPEQAIVEQGFSVEPALANGQVSEGAKILGYFTGSPVGLELWEFKELTQSEALSFVALINEAAFVAEDGKIQIQTQGESNASN